MAEAQGIIAPSNTLPPSPQKDALGRNVITNPHLTRSNALGLNSLASIMAAIKQQSLVPPRAGGGAVAVSQVPVPWRDSPLTRWLKDPLASSGHVLYIATVSPLSEVRRAVP